VNSGLPLWQLEDRPELLTAIFDRFEEMAVEQRSQQKSQELRARLEKSMGS
jgi:hypothetical protein